MPSNPQKLLTIGKPANSGDWPDYVADYSLSIADIPELVNMLRDKSFDQSRPSSKKFWTPVHVRRALGQLQASAAVTPLLEQILQTEDDDFATAEIPQVLGMIGEPALAPAQTLFCDRSQREFPRILAMDALAVMALRHPDLKAPVLALFTRYLQDAEAGVPGLNALLIMHLVDLEARELWDNIVPLFERGWVDSSLLDREDAEIEFGLRTERTTPRQSFAVDQPLPKPEGDDAEPMAILEYFLDKYGEDDALATSTELDGFFAALACAPETLLPSRWLPALWGGEDLMPDWETEEDIREFHDVLMSEYNLVMQDFIEHAYSPLFYAFEEGAPKWIFLEEWAFGFYRAVSLFSPMPVEDIAVFEQHTAGLRQIASRDGMEQLVKLGDQKIATLQEEIEAGLNALYQYFFQKRIASAHTPLTAGPRIGRNDLCPCGSGKKFKQCCLH